MDIVRIFENPSLSTKRNDTLNEYRKIGKFTDLTLKSTDGETMTVHKTILAACSPYFEGMFNSDLIEIRQELIELIDDLRIADLEILIEYIYTGKAKISLANAENIFIKAQNIQLVELQNFCSEFMIENIKIENSLIYWRNSIKYLNFDLTAACLNFINSNGKSFLEYNVSKLTLEELKHVMSTAEILVIDHADLFKLVSIWIKKDFERRKSNLMELINNLDFGKMSDEFIETEIISDKILQNNSEFLTKMVSITFQKMRAVKSQLNEKSEGNKSGLSSNNDVIDKSNLIELKKRKKLYVNWYNFPSVPIPAMSTTRSKHTIPSTKNLGISVNFR